MKQLGFLSIGQLDGRNHSPLDRSNERAMDWTSLSLAAGAASTSGINLYATVLTLGLLDRFHWLELPVEWRLLGETWVLILAGVLFVVEFIADKIPWVDSIWDAVHTFIRVPAGAVLMASAFANVDPGTRLAAALLGGSLALTTHSAKATAAWQSTRPLSLSPTASSVCWKTSSQSFF